MDHLKSPFGQILTLSLKKFNSNLPCNLQPSMIGLVVFGGVDQVSYCVVENNAFDDGFSKKK